MRQSAVVLTAAVLLIPFADGVAPLEDDAASGMDAGDTRGDALVVAPNVEHDGVVLFADEDWYAVVLPADTTVEASIFGTAACLELYPPGVDVPVGDACGYANVQLGVPRGAGAPAGAWAVRVRGAGDVAPGSYSFRVATAPTQGEPLLPELPVPAPASPADPVLPPVTPAREQDPHVVVAVVDTGINPYHRFFRAPGLQAHPSTWLPGFPASATSVRLTLDAPTFQEALAQDDATWRALRRSSYHSPTGTYVTHLYTFPGTRVVGAVSLGEYVDDLVQLEPAALRPIYDEHGHGTHSAGLAAGSNLSLADGNVLIVMVETDTFEKGVRWAARQPWIDAVSLSGGAIANVPTSAPAAGIRGSEEVVHELEAAGKPYFVASGNGISNTGLAPDFCSTDTNGYTAPSWATRVGAATSVEGWPTWWHCWPVEATARTDVPSPDTGTYDGAGEAGGTSASAPNAAGHWASLMLRARAAGLAPSGPEALRHLLHAATPTRAPPGTLYVAPVTEATSPLVQGYGLVDGRAVGAALATLAQGEPTPRPDIDAWRETEQALRDAAWG